MSSATKSEIQVSTNLEKENNELIGTSSKQLKLSKTWSQKQIPKSLAMKGPRFETVKLDKQPNPVPAIDLISKIPIKTFHDNIVSCDGGGGSLGHPTIYINLVKQ